MYLIFLALIVLDIWKDMKWKYSWNLEEEFYFFICLDGWWFGWFLGAVHSALCLPLNIVDQVANFLLFLDWLGLVFSQCSSWLQNLHLFCRYASITKTEYFPRWVPYLILFSFTLFNSGECNYHYKFQPEFSLKICDSDNSPIKNSVLPFWVNLIKNVVSETWNLAMPIFALIS